MSLTQRSNFLEIYSGPGLERQGNARNPRDRWSRSNPYPVSISIMRDLGVFGRKGVSLQCGGEIEAEYFWGRKENPMDGRTYTMMQGAIKPSSRDGDDTNVIGSEVRGVTPRNYDHVVKKLWKVKDEGRSEGALYA